MPTFLRAFIRLVLAIWFRKVEVVDAAGVPIVGPRIIIANHENGLIDPLLIAGYLPVAPRFLAKSTLWKNPLLAILLALGRVIPVHRRQDAADGANPAQNEHMFRTAGQVLAECGTIALFPEGQSHSEPQLQPLKTGAARLALAAPANVRIVPVGIVFEDKQRFRTRALLVVGEALDTDAERMTLARDAADAVRALTERMNGALRQVTINADTWTDRRLLERAAEIVSPESDSLEQRHLRMRELLDGYHWLAAERPGHVPAVRAAVAQYDNTLDTLEVHASESDNDIGLAAIGRWVVLLFGAVLLRAPVALVGILLNFIPYRAVAWLASHESKLPDEPASWKLLAALVIYPSFWSLLAVAAGLWVGGLVACGLLVVAPLSGYVAIRWLERSATLGEHARSFLLWPWRRRRLEELRKARATVADALTRLEDEWRRETRVRRERPDSRPV